MDATIRLPNGSMLELGEDGRWQCQDDPSLADGLNRLGPLAMLPLGYVPEPVVAIARVVAELVGGEVVQAARGGRIPEGAEA